jgi:hypothetical protein
VGARYVIKVCYSDNLNGVMAGYHAREGVSHVLAKAKMNGFRTGAMLLVAAGCFGTPLAPPALANPEDIFESFTSHIRQQIQVDKKFFLDANVCTELFYKQMYKKPTPPAMQGVSWPGPAFAGVGDLTLADCQTRYPGGLQDAREDFSRTQSTLSLSLTFYEFALVGDRNDDERYSAAELQDILESFGLRFDSLGSPSGHLATLTAKFDDLRKSGNLDHLMASMGALYDKGYRFTSHDRRVLDQVMG